MEPSDPTQVNLFAGPNATEKAAQDVDDWVGKRKKGAATSARARAKHVTEMRAMMELKDWSKAKPCHFVALFTWCHETVYGLAPILDTDDYRNAVFAAARMLNTSFDKQITPMVAFIRWVWSREKARETKRRENGDDGDGFRISPRYQFSPKLLQDYRLFKARTGGLIK